MAARRVLRLPRWLDLLLWAAATLLCARLIYLPQARALGKNDALSAPAGQWLILDGMAQGAAITITTPLAGEVRLAATDAALDPATRAYLAGVGISAPDAHGRLRWAASGTGSAPATLQATLAAEQPDARIAISAIAGGSGLTLRSDRGTMTIRVQIDSTDTARGLIDLPGAAGQQSYGPGRPIAFVLPAGQSAELNFAVAKSFDLWPQGDGMDGPIALTSVEIGAGDGIATRVCGGPAGSILFGSSLFQPRVQPIPARSGCRAGLMTIGRISLDPDAIAAAPSGTAYVAGLLPVWETLKANPALTALLAALIAYPGARLTGLLKVGKETPAAATPPRAARKPPRSR